MECLKKYIRHLWQILLLYARWNKYLSNKFILIYLVHKFIKYTNSKKKSSFVSFVNVIYYYYSLQIVFWIPLSVIGCSTRLFSSIYCIVMVIVVIVLYCNLTLFSLILSEQFCKDSPLYFLRFSWTVTDFRVNPVGSRESGVGSRESVAIELIGNFISILETICGEGQLSWWLYKCDSLEAWRSRSLETFVRTKIYKS